MENVTFDLDLPTSVDTNDFQSQPNYLQDLNDIAALEGLTTDENGWHYTESGYCIESGLYKDVMENQEKSQILAALIQNYYGFGDFIQAENFQDYPEDFGGIYFSQSGSLVLLSIQENERLLDLLRQTEVPFQVKKCNYSLRGLLELTNEINQFYLDNPEHPISNNARAFGISIEENLLDVWLLENNNLKQEEFLSILPIEKYERNYFRFNHLEKIPTLEVTVIAGNNISSPLVVSSAGYRARSAGNPSQNGLVGSGHAMLLNHSITSGNTVIGSVIGRNMSGSSDCAWIRTNSSTTLNRTIRFNNLTYAASTVSSSNGLSVAQVGRVTQVTTGNVQNVAETVNIARPEGGSVVLTNLIRTNYNSANGDSGGLVYANSGTRPVAGIHVTNVSGGVYCTVQAISNALRVSVF
ncbi:MAG: S1 family peptidase [Turicibacter sp.]|nr:S1 family peptidase [Turicibacter sp.]